MYMAYFACITYITKKNIWGKFDLLLDYEHNLSSNIPHVKSTSSGNVYTNTLQSA